MAHKWTKTQFPGVRYREHPQRKHNGKPDRYFSIRYKILGKLKEEALGWSSEGWNAQKASLQRSELVGNQKKGSGPVTLNEKRELENQKREEKKAIKEQAEKDRLTFRNFFHEPYFPHTQIDKNERSWKREEQLFRIWIDPVIGEMKLKDISAVEINKVKSNMLNAGRAPRSVEYMLAVIRQIFNYAIFSNMYQGENPIKNVKTPKADNKRLRFLSPSEADQLLTELKSRSHQLYEMALLSLRTGARADEIFKLKWADIDIEHGRLTLWDTKNTNTRMGFMTQDIKSMFLKKDIKSNSDLVFPGRGGVKIVAISNSFYRAVDALGLNDNISDKRMKVVFHTLRHTYASWLVQKGEPLYTVKELMGHSDIKMTERYAHLANTNLENAVSKLDGIKIG
ncbi:site-specific integrase [Desulfobacter sp.]|uniref:tyrosine-type recombinase/integrase n=1 Tax=Desulfobacter sp. TaxID=2294 RepID=UPI000E8AB4D6|nr:site-specific integrase [Desulfobacter sp.]HBT88148.1 integrase [Desulfobacter sp.]